MAAKHSRHIALTAPLVDYVEAQVALGNYASVSEIVRVALRLLKERDDADAARAILHGKSENVDEPRAEAR